TQSDRLDRLQILNVDTHVRRQSAPANGAIAVHLPVHHEYMQVSRPRWPGRDGFDLPVARARFYQRAPRREVTREVVVDPVRQERPTGIDLDARELTQGRMREPEHVRRVDPSP